MHLTLEFLHILTEMHLDMGAQAEQITIPKLLTLNGIPLHIHIQKKNWHFYCNMMF